MKPTIFEHNGRAFSWEDIHEQLKAVGIHDEDAVFVHADLRTCGKISAGVTRDVFLGAFAHALKESVGTGTVIVPTFSYSYCKNELFDKQKTPSTVGVLSEYIRIKHATHRSSDPIFSVAAWGKDAQQFTDVDNNCFGKNSIFEHLYKKNAQLCFIGERFDITFMHYVEQSVQVPYRYMKTFTGKTQTDGKLTETTVQYFVRYLDRGVEYDLEKIARLLEQHGILKKAALGNSIIRCVRAKDAFDVLKMLIKQDTCVLLKKHIEVST